MEISIENWLLAQLTRQDIIGEIARSWFAFGPRIPSSRIAFADWRNNDGKIKFRDEDLQLALREYEIAMIDLKAGVSPESFPSALANEAYLDILNERGGWHEKNSELSSANYLWMLHRNLSEYVKSQTILYLDTCYWVGMREALINGKSLDYLLLFQRLEKLRKEGIVFCPVSEPLFDELIRQSDRSTRATTALLMDQLSAGICLQSKMELIQTEIRRQIYRCIKPEVVEAWCEWIFTKAGFMHGCELPYNNHFSEAKKCYLQKVFIDSCWFGSLVKDVAALADNPAWEHQDNKHFAKAYNNDFKFYRERQASRDQIREQEIALTWNSLYKEEFEKISREIMDTDPEACARYCNSENHESGPSSVVIPQLQIHTTLSTFFALDHKKDIKPTDIPDIDHASFALPYVDIFACDRRLAHAIKAGPHRLDSAYQTSVVGSVADLIVLLDKRF